MEMTIKKNYETRRRILAVVLFFGMSAATVQVFAAPNDTADGVDENLAEENKISSSGVQISGMSGTVTQSEDISSRGNAVEFNGAFVRSFNLSSKLTGGKYAIYIDGNSLVRNININDGAKIFGDIVSAWQTENYSPDRVTNLNINTDFIFDGNISGAESIKLHVSDATMKFSGAADILSVDVGYGAQLFGGTFNLNNMSHKLAEGVIDTTTGTFINHGTIGAGSPETNLVINGNLISDGVLQKVSGGKAGMIIVNGNANVNGSTVTTDSMLPNETATVLIAKSVTGRIKNSADNPYPLSAFLSATGEIVGNSVVVKTYATTNEEIFTPQESETFTAMREMFERLDDNKRNEMRPLYNMTPPEAKRTLTQIGSNDAAQIMSVAQQNIAVDRMISHRVSKVFAPEHVNVNVHPIKFADGEDASPEVTVKVKVPKRQENNFWLNY
ncbi:MAG: hypothetical protein IJG32_09890, partial [Selenomonadaceae bacterium]|nr:hypothetical protein [Selenomonadaceae bacterium]